MKDRWVRLAEVASGQLGLFTMVQAYEAGFTPVMVRRCLATGQWQRVVGRVLAGSGVVLTWELRLRAACTSAGEDAVASHSSAGRLGGLEGFEGETALEVTVPRSSRVRGAPGVLLHRSRDLGRSASTKRSEVPATTVARTLLDLAAVCDDDRALRSPDDARRRRLVGWPVLCRTLIGHARPGRPGIRRFRRVLARRYGKEVPGSVLAAAVLGLLNQAGLPEPACEFLVKAGGREYHVDLAYPHARLAIECDGRHGHSHERAFEIDRRRQNHLELEGWMVLRYTWDRVEHDPEGIVAEVRTALARRAA